MPVVVRIARVCARGADAAPIWNDALASYRSWSGHPLDPRRLELTVALVPRLDLAGGAAHPFLAPRVATGEDVRLVCGVADHWCEERVHGSRRRPAAGNGPGRAEVEANNARTVQAVRRLVLPLLTGRGPGF